MERFYDLAVKRRSIRKYTAEPLSQEELTDLLGATLMAPSSKGSFCWEMVVVTDRAHLEELARCKEHGAAMLSEAAAAVVFVADPSVSDVWVEDASVATTYMLLQAEDANIGACWIQIRNRFTAEGEPSEDAVRRLLDIPAHLRVLSIVSLGHKGIERRPYDTERLKWEKVHLHQYKVRESSHE